MYFSFLFVCRLDTLRRVAFESALASAVIALANPLLKWARVGRSADSGNSSSKENFSF